MFAAPCSFRSFLKALANRYAAGRQLSRFDDRMLSDIGLSRSDLDAAFSAPIWQDPTSVLAERRTDRLVRSSSKVPNEATIAALTEARSIQAGRMVAAGNAQP